MNPSDSPARRRWLHLVLLWCGLGLLAWILYRQRDTLVQVAQHRWDWRLYGAAVGCVVLCELGAALRWYILVRPVAAVPWRTAWRLGLIGVVCNAVTPGANGGDLVKAGVVLASRLPRTMVLSSLILDRAIGLLGLLLLASAAAVAWWPTAPVGLEPLLIAIWIVAGGAALGVVALFHPQTATVILRLATRVQPLRSVLEQLALGAAAYRTAWRRLLGALCLTLGCNFLSIASFFFVDWMLFPSAELGFGQHLVLVPLLLAATALPLPGGAIGVIEEISQQLFQLAGHPGGALAMLGYRVAYLGAVAVATVGWLVLWRRSQEGMALATAPCPADTHQLVGRAAQRTPNRESS
jgi:glycosyltransferase 2 family protein